MFGAATAAAAAGAYTLWSGLVDPWLARASDSGFNQGNLLAGLFFSGAFWEGWDVMQNTIELLSTATLGAVAVFFFWRWRRIMATAALAAATVGLLTLSPATSAAEINHGNPNYTLQEGNEVKTDLIVAAQHTRIDGDVDGDLIVWSRNVTVNGHIKGDILAFGQEVRVNGPVDGNVRVFAQSLELNSAVGKNVMAWGRELDMDEKASVGGTVTLGSANAQLDGRITGDLLAIGDLDVNGAIGGNALVRGQRLRIGPAANIAGKIRYRGGRPPVVESGAKLASGIEVLSRVALRPNYASPRFYWRQILAWGASLIFGVVLFWIAPRLFLDVKNSGRRFGRSFGWGFLVLIVTPIAAIIACFTIVGLGVGITTFFLYIVAIYAAQVFIAGWVGEKLLGPASAAGAIIGRLALGLAVLRLLRLIPFAGRLVGLLVVIWGLGALAVAIYEKLRPQLATSA